MSSITKPNDENGKIEEDPEESETEDKLIIVQQDKIIKEDIHEILTKFDGVNIEETQNLIDGAAKKSNLTLKNIKQILDTIINNDDVRTLVEHKMRAEKGNEDLDLSCLNFKPIFTRSKTKEKMKQEKVQAEQIQVLDIEFPDSSDGEDFVPENEKSLADEEDEGEEADDESEAVNTSTIEENSQEQASEYDDLIALRTRSKNPLKDTTVETIQAQLPMIDFDVNDQAFENQKTDELWEDFILTLNKPLNDNSINDEDNDSDFKYQEEEVGVDPFEMRSDKGVNISKKELKNLWQETIDTNQEQATFGEIDFSFIVASTSDTEQPISPRIELESEVDNISQIEITQNELDIIKDQLRMLVQISVQMYLLGLDNPDFMQISYNSIEILNNLSNYKNLMPSNCPLSDIHNFETAFTLVENIAAGLNDKQHIVQKSSGLLSISKSSQNILINSPVFMYPQLLPKSIYFKVTIKKKFLNAEDYLIAIGLERYMEDKKQLLKPSELIANFLLPSRTASQIRARIKIARNMEKNCIKYFYKHNKCPKLMHFPLNIKPGDDFAPCNKPLNSIPKWMVPSMKTKIDMPVKAKVKRVCRTKNVIKDYKPRPILPKTALLNISPRKPLQVLLPQNHLPSKDLKYPLQSILLNKPIVYGTELHITEPSSPILIQCYQNQIVSLAPSTSQPTQQTVPTPPTAPPSNDQQSIPQITSAVPPPPIESIPSTSETLQNKSNKTTSKPSESKKRRRILPDSSNSKSSKRQRVSTASNVKKPKSSIKKGHLKRVTKSSNAAKSKSEDEEVGSADNINASDKTDEADKLFDNESQEETCDEEEQALAALMHASSTISKKPSGTLLKKKVIKNIKEVEATLALLEPNILEKDPKREEKEAAFVSNFFHQVLEAFNHEQAKLESFIECLMQIKTGDKPVSQVYQEISNMLKAFPTLLNDFVLFLKPEQAQECGKIQEYWFYQNVLVFLRKLEIFTQNQPQQLQKILKNFKKTQEGLTNDIPSSIRHNPYLLEEFTKLIPQEKPPPAIDDQEFEVIALPDSGDEGSIDSVESLKLPEEEDLYGTKNCPCACHSAQDKHCLKHCVQCGIKFIGGRVYLKTSNALKPAKVVFVNGDGTSQPSPNKDASNSSPVSQKIDDESMVNLVSKPMGSDMEEDPGEGSSSHKEPLWNSIKDYVILSVCNQKGYNPDAIKSCAKILDIDARVAVSRYEKLTENISHGSSSDPTFQALELLEKSNIPLNQDTSWSRERDFVMLNYCQQLGASNETFQKAGKILGMAPTLVETRYNQVMSLVEKNSEDETMDETFESESEEESEGEVTLESTNKQHTWTKDQDFVVLSLYQEKGQKTEVFQEIATRLNLSSWKLARDRIKAVLNHYHSQKQAEEKESEDE